MFFDLVVNVNTFVGCILFIKMLPNMYTDGIYEKHAVIVFITKSTQIKVHRIPLPYQYGHNISLLS